MGSGFSIVDKKKVSLEQGQYNNINNNDIELENELQYNNNNNNNNNNKEKLEIINSIYEKSLNDLIILREKAIIFEEQGDGVICSTLPSFCMVHGIFVDQWAIMPEMIY
jgi:hypothetical protein